MPAGGWLVVRYYLQQFAHRVGFMPSVFGGAWEGPAWWKEKRMIFEAIFRHFVRLIRKRKQ